jgi:hypothetical protein
LAISAAACFGGYCNYRRLVFWRQSEAGGRIIWTTYVLNFLGGQNEKEIDEQ